MPVETLQCGDQVQIQLLRSIRAKPPSPNSNETLLICAQLFVETINVFCKIVQQGTTGSKMIVQPKIFQIHSYSADLPELTKVVIVIFLKKSLLGIRSCDITLMEVFYSHILQQNWTFFLLFQNQLFSNDTNIQVEEKVRKL